MTFTLGKCISIVSFHQINQPYRFWIYFAYSGLFIWHLAADPEYATEKKVLWEKLSDFMKQENDKGLTTEMNALTRQPKNQAEH